MKEVSDNELIKEWDKMTEEEKVILIKTEWIKQLNTIKGL